MSSYADQIAKASFDIDAIMLRPDDPFTWASGYRMPIYNDNRKHLRSFDSRKLIVDSFLDIIRSEDIRVDAVTGTSTAGIWPAASLAYELNVPLGIIDTKTGSVGDGEEYLTHSFSPERVTSLINNLGSRDFDLIVSTSPASIIPSVVYANQRKLPFAYVREKQKGHGLKQQIEGVLKLGDKVLLIDFFNGYSYLEKAISAIKESGGVVAETFSQNILPGYQSPNFRGKNVLHVEDLVSTGGSSLEEMTSWRRNGTNITHCLSIFSYDFPEITTKFEEKGIVLIPSLNYEQLLLFALKNNQINKDQHDLLKEWRTDPFAWGEKNGFPKVEKK